MQKALKDIQSGKFAKGWIAEYAAGLPNYKRLLKDGEKHSIEKTGERLRGLMPWIRRRISKGRRQRIRAGVQELRIGQGDIASLHPISRIPIL